MNNVNTLLPSKPQYGKGKGFSIMISFLDESLDLLSFSKLVWIFKRDYSTTRFYIHTNRTHFMNTHGKYSHIFLLTTMITVVVMLGLASSISSTLFAQSPLHSGHAAANDTISKYTGQEDRIIKSLSSEDIKSLQTGTGDAFGGMAKLAELNGYPGPRHVLDLANKLKLTDEQKKNITTIYNDMKKKAIELGQKIVDIERIANEEFVNKSITDTQIKQLILKSAEIYGQLRYTHLNTHLKMLDILTSEQTALYNSLRGYSYSGQ